MKFIFGKSESTSIQKDDDDMQIATFAVKQKHNGCNSVVSAIAVQCVQHIVSDSSLLLSYRRRQVQVHISAVALGGTGELLSFVRSAIMSNCQQLAAAGAVSVSVIADSLSRSHPDAPI